MEKLENSPDENWLLPLPLTANSLTPRLFLPRLENLEKAAILLKDGYVGFMLTNRASMILFDANIEIAEKILLARNALNNRYQGVKNGMLGCDYHATPNKEDISNHKGMAKIFSHMLPLEEIRAFFPLGSFFDNWYDFDFSGKIFRDHLFDKPKLIEQLGRTYHLSPGEARRYYRQRIDLRHPYFVNHNLYGQTVMQFSTMHGLGGALLNQCVRQGVNLVGCSFNLAGQPTVIHRHNTGDDQGFEELVSLFNLPKIIIEIGDSINENAVGLDSMSIFAIRNVSQVIPIRAAIDYEQICEELCKHGKTILTPPQVKNTDRRQLQQKLTTQKDPE